MDQVTPFQVEWALTHAVSFHTTQQAIVQGHHAV